MRIGIMGAMPEEIELIKSMMSDVEEESFGGRNYFCGKINDIDVVLVFSRWGKVAASSTATSLINNFKIDKVIFTGVAGAINEDLNIGDVVVSSQLYQHDMDAEPLFKKHEIPLTGVTFFKSDAALVASAKAAIDEALAEPSDFIPTEKLEIFGIVSPKCIIGTIATGDQFISDIEKTARIKADYPETLAVEMEGAAVGQICHEYEIPFVVIRTISDKADHKAHIDFPQFIENVASHYSEQAIKYMLRS
jgi:adenosylhomocysteine nucleosidase